MKIRRHYALPEGWERIANVRGQDGQLTDPAQPEGACLNPPPFSHMEIIHTGTSPEQNFSTDFVLDGLRDGWIELSNSELRLIGQPETMIYQVLRKPGCYCSHCGKQIDRGDRGELARLHVAMEHAGQTIQGNPAGYEVINHFECVLGAEQHERMKAGG